MPKRSLFLHPEWYDILACRTLERLLAYFGPLLMHPPLPAAAWPPYLVGDPSTSRPRLFLPRTPSQFPPPAVSFFSSFIVRRRKKHVYFCFRRTKNYVHCCRRKKNSSTFRRRNRSQFLRKRKICSIFERGLPIFEETPSRVAAASLSSACPFGAFAAWIFIFFSHL